jgi:hypothetical protein
MLTQALYGRHELTVQSFEFSDKSKLGHLASDGLNPQGPNPSLSGKAVAKDLTRRLPRNGFRGFCV